jgi:hypothetical protein
MITCSITKKQLTILTDYAWYVIPADDKEMCRYIVGKIIWEEMQKHTDIQTPEMDEKIEKNIELYKEMLAKNKKMLKFRAFFFTIQNCIIVENHKLNVYQLVQHLFL